MLKKSIMNKINEINDNLDDLKGETNINEILKKYTDTHTKLESINEILNDIKDIFKTITEKTSSQPTKILTDDEYIEYMEFIEDEIEDIDDFSIEKQIEKYEKINKKINLCKHYLQSKKMTIENHDE